MMTIHANCERARARSHTLTRTHVKETANEVASQEIIGININTFAL